MGLETGTYISDLNIANATPGDPKSQGDDHFRLIKSVLKNTLPALTGAVLATHTELNCMQGATGQPAMKDGSNLTTPTVGDNSTKIATTAFVAGASFASALPSQAGNADKIITTDGTNGGWTSALKSTVIRFKDGTDATKLLAFDLTGLTAATTRTLKVPDKSDTLATLSDINYQLIGQATVSSAVANIDFLSLFTDTYNKYVIEVEGVMPSATSNLALRVAYGGIVSSGASDYLSMSNASSSMVATSQLSTISSGAEAPYGATMTIEIRNARSSFAYKSVSFRGRMTVSQESSDGSTAVATPISGFRLYWLAGANFTAGKVRVYGVRA